MAAIMSEGGESWRNNLTSAQQFHVQSNYDLKHFKKMKYHIESGEIKRSKDEYLMWCNLCLRPQDGFNSVNMKDKEYIAELNEFFADELND